MHDPEESKEECRTGMSGPTLSRRNLAKTAAATALMSAWPTGRSFAANKGKPTLDVSGYGYDRIRAIQDRSEGVEGYDIRFHLENIYTVNRLAFGRERKYGITEIGLIPYISQYINKGYRGYTLIPVFISRVFRHRNIFVRADSGITNPEDLRGRRIGTPGYAMSSHTWIRGFLQDEYGIKPGDVEWIETTRTSDTGAKTKAGSVSAEDYKVGPLFPADFPMSRGPEDTDESDLLLEKGCDALVTAINPKAFVEGDPRIRRLFPNVRKAEQAYFQSSGMFPIMHAVAIRDDLIEADPGLPAAVFEMYSLAKLAAYRDLETTTSLRVTLPWAEQELEDTRAIMGEDFWAYGIARNRKELSAVMRYCHEQFIVKERLGFEELFHPSTLKLEEPEPPSS